MDKPPEDAWRMTQNPVNAPRDTMELVIGFVQGVPVSINGQNMGPVQLLEWLNELAGRYGIGRMDMVENRVVGLKSREVYEGPAAVILHKAHLELERIVLDRPTSQYKARVAQDFANIVYDGLWFGPLREALQAFVEKTQQTLTGEVRVRLSAGTVLITGRRSPFSLYDDGLATYSEGDTFDRESAAGFLKLYGLSYATWGRIRRNNRSQ